MEHAFAVYWRTTNRQLFSFRQSVIAASAREARSQLRRALKRQTPVLVGVKQLAACGRRCACNGRWVG